MTKVLESDILACDIKDPLLLVAGNEVTWAGGWGTPSMAEEEEQEGRMKSTLDIIILRTSSPLLFFGASLVTLNTTCQTTSNNSCCHHPQNKRIFHKCLFLRYISRLWGMVYSMGMQAYIRLFNNLKLIISNDPITDR